MKGLSRTDPSQKGLSGTDPSQKGPSGTDPSQKGPSGTDPSQMSPSGTNTSQMGLSKTDPFQMGVFGTCSACAARRLVLGACRATTRNAGMRTAVEFTSSPVCTSAMYAHVNQSSVLCELLLCSLRHGRTRQWNDSPDSRQRNLTWSQPPAQPVNACRALREPAGTREMWPASTRSHPAACSTTTCPERACGFANKILHAGRTIRGNPS